jgi:hypothetical protein
MKETGDESPGTIRRLCSEIQLFDLCDRETCGSREGRFCTDQDLLDRFERISEDDRRPVERYPAEEPDEDAEGEYDDAFGVDDLDDEGDGWEDE